MVKGLKKYIPDYFYESIYDIDFLSFYNNGIRLIFLDIDNTLVKYTEKDASEKVIKLVNLIEEIGFEVVVISNNYKKRIKRLCEPLGLRYVYAAIKPLRRGYRKALRISSRKYKKEEIIMIGDQLMTDIKGANKMGYQTILVKPLERSSDVITTKINRIFERRRLKQIKKHYPEVYESRLKSYENM